MSKCQTHISKIVLINITSPQAAAYHKSLPQDYLKRPAGDTQPSVLTKEHLYAEN